ncbi:MAG: hypothetical protein LBC87_08530 [Fibromonadaceae bacterium]|jgi:5-methylcytosine-specific restriction enzyme subunit McrC|nr:hypothetical protein [Fibromonadaceae bacterium]
MKNKTITRFEHQSLRRDESEFSDEKYNKALEFFYRGDKKGFPYYSLIHNGIKFNSYVGVIQFRNTIIEILPKADKNDYETDKEDKEYEKKERQMARNFD